MEKDMNKNDIIEIFEAREEMKSLFSAWNFREICEDKLESYEQGVMLELIELCETIAGVESRRSE